MGMKENDEDVNNDKAYDDDTRDVHIVKTRFDIEVGGYAYKASVDYENGNDVVVDVYVLADDDDDDDPNDGIRICTCLKQ